MDTKIFLAAVLLTLTGSPCLMAMSNDHAKTVTRKSPGERFESLVGSHLENWKGISVVSWKTEPAASSDSMNVKVTMHQLNAKVTGENGEAWTKEDLQRLFSGSGLNRFSMVRDIGESGWTMKSVTQNNLVEFSSILTRLGFVTAGEAQWVHGAPTTLANRVAVIEAGERARSHVNQEGCDAIATGSLPERINVDAYLALFADLREARLPEGVDRRAWATRHYIEHGNHEIERGVRRPNYFDVNAYLSFFPDLREVQLPEGVNRETWAVCHFLEHGRGEIERGDRSPTDFDYVAYLAFYMDLGKETALLEPDNAKRAWAIHHYLEYGHHEIENGARPDYRKNN